ncbi:hypothetical protein HDU89_003137 [Geranomyces variabilis]|nr:hypothetical protein HDU89_003137 [Geranomyces variabilis]
MRDSPRTPSAAARGHKRARTTSPSSPISSQTKRRKETALTPRGGAETVSEAPATIPRRSASRWQTEGSELNVNEEALNDASISDFEGDHNARVESRHPEATPDSRVIGIKAAVLIGLDVTGSLVDDNAQLAATMWGDIRECYEYAQMIVADDCDASENVRRVKVLAAYDSLRRMQRHMHETEESLLLTRRNLLEIIAHLLMSGMPPDDNKKTTTKVLQEVFIQSYIHRRLLMISESSNEADDDLADEDVAFQSLWNFDLPAVNAHLIAKVKSQVAVKIRKDSLDTLMEKHIWDTFYNAAQAFVRQIAEQTERGIDLAALAAEVKAQLLPETADAESQKSVFEISSEDENADPESGQPSRDTSVDALESSEDISVSSGIDDPVTAVAGGHDDPDDDDELDSAVRGEVIAQLMAREEALADAASAAKGKGRIDTPPISRSPSVTSVPPIVDTPGTTGTPRPLSPLSKPRSTNKKAVSTSRQARTNGASHKNAAMIDTPYISDSEASAIVQVPKTPARQPPKAAPPRSSRPAASGSRSTSAAAAPCQLTKTGEPIVPAAYSPAPEDSGAPSSPPRSARRRRVAWSRADEEELERGLALHRDKYARWRAILVEGQAKGRFEARTNVMLKDKARQMKEARKRAGLALGGFQWATDRSE